MMVLSQDGSYEAISNIEEKHYENAPTVWNLELDTDTNSDNHYVLANGIVTGDLFLQNLLRKK
ncbi:MAG: hypothetical protein NTX25_01965 [Proteobacteria bacterium]|nr:hypothetical protein [Pseudomonadota bacterium]